MSKRGIPQSNLEFDDASLKGRASTVGAGSVEQVPSMSGVAKFCIAIAVIFLMASFFSK